MFRCKFILALLVALVWGCSDDPDPGLEPGENTEQDADVSDNTGDADDVDDSDDPVPPLPDFEWPVETGPIEITPHESWKERIDYWSDPFIQSEYEQVGWVKFSVLVGDPSRVIFQNSHTYPYHYDFAAERLDPYLGIDRAAYDLKSLYEEGQEIILGAVLFPPQPSTMEIGIQLVRQDAYHPEMVRIIYELVRDSIDADVAPAAFYFPAFEQAPSTRQWASEYEARQIPISSVDRWLMGDACYSMGWAFGPVKFITADNVEEAYRNGELTSSDILLTDSIPADLPLVAGIVSLAPSTPNSHVAILANSYQIPFVYLRSEQERLAAMELDGKMGVLRARTHFSSTFNCDAQLVDGSGISAELADTLLALKIPGQIEYSPMQRAGHYAVPVNELMPSDIQYYGGKAANFGMLHRAVPDNMPEPNPLAFSFDLWMEFMEQEMPSGKTLQEEIDERLAPFTSYPPPPIELEAALDEIVSMIRNETQFTAEQEQAVLNALDGFDPLRRIRFRSSTNVEDSELFTGAGLYDSYSGCLADDLDDDDEGPSHCDSERENERGVFRAIRRVFGSFYNIRAFTERLRHGVNESEVGMGLLVHYSDPDPTELANGVITLNFNGSNSVHMTVVTQPEAASVTNPSDNAQPEIVEIAILTPGVYPTLIQGSELLPIGATTLEWEEEYKELATLVLAVVEEFQAAHPAKERFTLDLEYKKLVPGKLILRQVREIPRPADTQTPTYLIPGTIELCTFQGESGNVFGNHRGKVRWEVGLRGTALDFTSTSESLITSIDGEILVGDQVEAVQGDPAGWSGASAQTRDGESLNSFKMGSGALARDYDFVALAPTSAATRLTPIVFPQELSYRLTTNFAEHQPVVDWLDGATTTDKDNVLLSSCAPEVLTSDYIERDIQIDFGDTITARTHYWWPPPPRGITAGYTAPLIFFEKTVITGLGSEPIELSDYFSQTYRPEHHNFGENFYFDFLLEPELPQHILTMLQDEDIRALVSLSGTPYIIGFNGQLRPLGSVDL